MAASLLLAFLSVVVLVEGGVVPDHHHENRIIRGHQIDITQVPWQVAILANNVHNCGGSIISPWWVLTAAHCSDRYKASDITIRIGSTSWVEGGNLHQVEQIVNHEGYHGKPYLDDVSLMKTATEMNLRLTAKKVTLAAPGSKKPDLGTKLLVSGWGFMEDGSHPQLLRAVEVEVSDVNKCKKYNIVDEAMQICAGLAGKGTCKGDSGGPLMKGNVQVGIVSYARQKEPCGNSPGGYMDVAAYRGWIQRHVNL